MDHDTKTSEEVESVWPGRGSGGKSAGLRISAGHNSRETEYCQQYQPEKT